MTNCGSSRVSTVRGKKRSVNLSLAYADGKLTITRDKNSSTLQTINDMTIKPVVTAAMPIVDMPLRRPAYWTAKAKDLAAGSAEWLHAHRQLLASYAALRQPYKLRATVKSMTADGSKLTRGTSRS